MHILCLIWPAPWAREPFGRLVGPRGPRGRPRGPLLGWPVLAHRAPTHVFCGGLGWPRKDTCMTFRQLLSVHARLSGPRGPMGGPRGPAIPKARPPWSRGPMAGLASYSLFTSILLYIYIYTYMKPARGPQTEFFCKLRYAKQSMLRQFVYVFLGLGKSRQMSWQQRNESVELAVASRNKHSRVWNWKSRVWNW